MRTRFMLCAIEQMDADYPGLQGYVNDLLRRGIPATQIPTFLRKKYGIQIPAAQVWKYRTKRWIPRMRRISRDIERAEAIFEAAMRRIQWMAQQRRRDAPRERGWTRRERTKVVALIAGELFGESRSGALRGRLARRFQVFEPSELAPAQARAEIESLLFRLAQQTGESVESLRARIAAKIHGGGKHD